MKKATLNYWVDVSIGLSFVLSAVSGLVFLLPVGSGAGLNSGFLGIGYALWDSLHVWSSLAMMAGVLAHLVLHWKWIMGMTRKMLPSREAPRETTVPAPAVQLSRRRFLALGFTTVAAGVLVAGCAMLARRQADEPEQEDSAAGGSQDDAEPLSQQDDGYGSPDEPELLLQQEGNALVTSEPEQPMQQQSGVACPRGMVNDPYPGRCRNYTDSNGDGICDYSVPGSGTN